MKLEFVQEWPTLITPPPGATIIQLWDSLQSMQKMRDWYHKHLPEELKEKIVRHTYNLPPSRDALQYIPIGALNQLTDELNKVRNMWIDRLGQMLEYAIIEKIEKIDISDRKVMNAFADAAATANACIELATRTKERAEKQVSDKIKSFFEGMQQAAADLGLQMRGGKLERDEDGNIIHTDMDSGDQAEWKPDEDNDDDESPFYDEPDTDTK